MPSQADPCALESHATDILAETITHAEIADAYGVALKTVNRWGALGLLGPKVGLGRVPRRLREIVKKRAGEPRR